MSKVLRIGTYFSNFRLTYISKYEVNRLFGTSCRLASKEKECIPENLLEILVCPLSKKPLRYDASTNELVNDELGVAYPVIDGIPNLVPTDGRIIKTKEEKTKPDETD